MKTYTSVYRPCHFRAHRLAGVVCLALAFSSFAFCGPIHDAARKGDANKVKALLQTDPKLVSTKDNNGDTPLHIAAFHGQTQVVKVLLDAGADVNAKNKYGAFVPDDLWKVYSSNNHQDPVVLLKAHGVDQRDSENGYTPLDLAIMSVQHLDVLKLLVAKGADVNAQASSGATPLFWAVLRGQKDDVQFLLEHGANINAADAYGDTILDSALHLQFGSMIQLLVDKGADVNAKDQSERRPLTYALQMDDHKYAEMLSKHGAHE